MGAALHADAPDLAPLPAPDVAVAVAGPLRRRPVEARGTIMSPHEVAEVTVRT